MSVYGTYMSLYYACVTRFSVYDTYTGHKLTECELDAGGVHLGESAPPPPRRCVWLGVHIYVGYVHLVGVYRRTGGTWADLHRLRSGSEKGSCVRLIDGCITRL